MPMGPPAPIRMPGETGRFHAADELNPGCLRSLAAPLGRSDAVLPEGRVLLWPIIICRREQGDCLANQRQVGVVGVQSVSEQLERRNRQMEQHLLL